MFRAVTSVAAFFVLRRRRCVVGDAVFHSRHGAWPAVPEQEQPCVSFIFSCLQDTIILVTGKKLSSSTEKSGRETPEDVLCSKVPKLGDHAWTVTRIMKTAGEGNPPPCLMPGSQLHLGRREELDGRLSSDWGTASEGARSGMLRQAEENWERTEGSTFPQRTLCC